MALLKRMVPLAATLALLVALRALVPMTGYESELAGDALNTFLHAFLTTVLVAPFAACVAGIWVGVVALLIPRLPQRARRRRALYQGGSLGPIILSILLLIQWAATPPLWAWVGQHRFWIIAASMPLFLMAMVDAHLVRPDRGAFRPVLVAALGALFIATTAVQSVGIWRANTLLTETIAANSGACVDQRSLAWAWQTPLQNYAVSSHSILLQSRAPSALVLSGGACGDPEFAKRIRLADWDVRPREGGWFDLTRAGLTK